MVPQGEKKIVEYEFPVELEPQKEGGFLARCPIWSDCYAFGDTLEEAVQNMNITAQKVIKQYQEKGLKIPFKVKQEINISNHFSISVTVIS